MMVMSWMILDNPRHVPSKLKQNTPKQIQDLSCADAGAWVQRQLVCKADCITSWLACLQYLHIRMLS